MSMSASALGMPGPGRRPFYAHAWLFLSIGLVVVLLAFWPSFFSRPAANATPHLLHGITATAWVVLLVTQALLMRLRRNHVHRRLGRLGYVLMPALVVTGAWVMHEMFAGRTNLPPPAVPVLGFADLVALAYLATAFTLAMVHRRDMQRHARWLASTMLVVLPPATTRLAFLLLPGIDFPLALGIGFGSVIATAALLLLLDWRAGKPRAPYAAAGATLLATYLLMGPVGSSAAWQALGAWIGGR